jgi:prolyl oligopeptidase
MKRILISVLVALAPSASFADSAVESWKKLADDWWETQLENSPVYATFTGDNRFNNRLDELGPKARRRWQEKVADLEKRAAAIPPAQLEESDRVSLDLLRLQLDLERRQDKFKLYEWAIDPNFGPQSWLAQLINFTPLKTDKDLDDLDKRLEQFPRFFHQYIGELTDGLGDGRIAPKIAVERVLKQLDEMLAKPVEQSPWGEKLGSLPAPVAARREALIKRVSRSVYPALADLRGFLRDKYLPKARVKDVGLSTLPDGIQTYRFQIFYHTTENFDPNELHELGLNELKSIQDEIRAIAGRMGHKGDLASFFKKIKSNPKNFFRTREDIEKTAQENLRRAVARLPKFFGHVPKTECVVKPIESFREKDAVAAFYYEPPDDLSRPGIYYVNTYAPQTRPRFGAAALAAHESVPGHHMQIAIAMETSLPAFRRHAQFNAFTEGWGLYSERLADEMGLYRDDSSRFGMLTYQAWRACRLVVDTGIHAKGWSRDKAIDFMAANSALSREEIVNEVDRYIVWPGQALAYMVGEKELMKLRLEAKEKMGKRFDLKEFHDVVLKNGSIPLSTLDAVVRDWEEERAHVTGRGL